jgi:hypothetical protein
MVYTTSRSEAVQKRALGAGVPQPSSVQPRSTRQQRALHVLPPHIGRGYPAPAARAVYGASQPASPPATPHRQVSADCKRHDEDMQVN